MPFAPLTLGPEHKSMPPGAWGRTADAFLDGGPTLSDLPTPLLTADLGAVAANTATMAGWAAEHGLLLAPHGKTSMAPALWQRLLDAGRLGPHARDAVAGAGGAPGGRAPDPARERAARPGRHPLAPRRARRRPRIRVPLLVGQRRGGPASSPTRSVRAGGDRPVDVLVELGGAGGRTGARSIDTAREVAAAIEGSGVLRLAGVAGYEGALAHDRSPAAIAAVQAYLERMRALAAELAPRIERPAGDQRRRQRLLRPRRRGARSGDRDEHRAAPLRRLPAARQRLLRRHLAVRRRRHRPPPPAGAAPLEPGALPPGAGPRHPRRGPPGRPVRRGPAGARADPRPHRRRRGAGGRPGLGPERPARLPPPRPRADRRPAGRRGRPARDLAPLHGARQVAARARDRFRRCGRTRGRAS